MSKPFPNIFFYAIIALVMFGIFKTLFSQGVSKELEEALRQKAFLVDVRTPAEFAAGSVPGAVNIPLDRVEQSLNQFKGKGPIVVFCRSGMRSSEARSILVRNGCKKGS
jgi:rhodanese-related sulfurtransferase